MNVDVSDTTVTVNGTERSFPVPIREWLDFGDVLVVRLEVTMETHEYGKRNVIGLASDGTTVWIVPKAPDPADSGEITSYTSISRKLGDQLWAYNANGFSYRLDPSDGSILDRQFKR